MLSLILSGTILESRLGNDGEPSVMRETLPVGVIRRDKNKKLTRT
jgi:hypothetical protein